MVDSYSNIGQCRSNNKSNLSQTRYFNFQELWKINSKQSENTPSMKSGKNIKLMEIKSVSKNIKLMKIKKCEIVYSYPPSKHKRSLRHHSWLRFILDALVLIEIDSKYNIWILKFYQHTKIDSANSDIYKSWSIENKYSSD